MSGSNRYHSESAQREASRSELSASIAGQVSDWWHRPFSSKEVLLSSSALVLLGSALVLFLARQYPYYPCCFQQLSAAIRHWDFQGLDPSQPKEFWGYPYLSALLAAITRLPDVYAIVVVSSLMFVVANYLCGRLWGTTVAIWFTVANWWYIDGAVEGLTEPLFMALLLGSFLAMRKERWALAAALASGCTVVRPVGILALLALGVVLLKRREFRQLAIATAIGFVTGVAYVIPLKLIYGDPLANVHGYSSQDWSSSLPVGLPFRVLINGAADAISTWHTVHPEFRWEPFIVQLVIAGWVLVALAGVIKMAADKRFSKSYANTYPAEAIFAITYALFLFSYNSREWTWQFFPRFAIPLAPFLVSVLLDRLTTDRRVIWSVALFNLGLTVWTKGVSLHMLASHLHRLHLHAL